MKRSHLGIVLLLALVVSLANDVASECRLLSHAFLLDGDRFGTHMDRSGTHLMDAILDHQEPLSDDPEGDTQRAAARARQNGTLRVADTEHPVPVIVPADRLSRAPPSA